MKARAGRDRAGWGLGGAFLLAALATHAAAWQVQEAPVRFTLRLAEGPTHPEAGYLVRVPDGGLLPQKYPLPHVVKPDGSVVESYSLWHGPDTGLWVVFADPGRVDRVDVYVSRAKQSRTWTPETGLRPSPMLISDATRASLADAQKLAKPGSIGPRVDARAQAGIPQAPLSVGGDPSGRPRPTSFYLNAYVHTSDPGRTWIAPFFQAGQNEVRVDGGAPLQRNKRAGKWGGTGQWVNLAKGLHRIEIFSASEPRGAYTEGKFMGHCYLAWRTPRMPDSELGANPAAEKPKDRGAAWEARVIKDHEIVRSGQCELEAASARDGGPVAAFTLEPTHNFWFEGEEPLGIYAFKAVKEGNPANTTYQWTLGGGARTTGSSFTWLVPGLREHRVALTAISGNRRSTCSVPFFGFSTVETRLADHHHRRAFRLAMQTVLEAYPGGTDPCGNWTDAYWRNLVRTAEYGKGYPLLRNLLGKRRPTANRKLPQSELRFLEDIFLDVAPRVDPVEGLKWIKALREVAPDAGRRAELSIREAEVFLIYLDKPREGAERLARVARQSLDEAERARIRLGDYYLQQGELNKASRLYSDVQQRVRRKRNAPVRPGERPVESWKLGAVQEASISATVADLIDKGEYLLARQALDRWERTAPISKISEDFVLQEARLYMALTDWKRARWLLEPYCRIVDASSFLPESATTLLRCMDRMKESPEVIRETATMLKKRLEFHPVALDLQDYIREP